MGWAGKLALAAVIAGLAIALALIAATSPPASGASALPISRADAPHPTVAVPAHCRAATGAVPECTAAWEAKRRRFFGKKEE